MGLIQYPYQAEGTAFLDRAGRAVCADEPGLGKTSMSLLAARGKTLVVAPPAFESIWEEAVQDWHSQIDGSVEFEMCSYNVLTRRDGSSTYPVLRPEWKGHWDTIIFDEAHYLKGRKTKWTQAAEKLSAERMFFLTGTPIPNWAHEIYMLLKLMYPGDRRFTNYSRWLARWFKLWEPPWGGSPKPTGLLATETWESFYRGNGLEGRWLRRLQKDVLADLPPLRQQTIEVEMGPKQQRIYRALQNEMYAKLEDGTEILAWSSGGMYTKLHRVSTGVELEEPSNPASAKMDMLQELMRDRGGNATLILCRFRDTAAITVQRMDALGLRALRIDGGVPTGARGDVIKSFQAGEAPVLVATIDTIAEGYTLTRADWAIFVERHPRPSKNEQAAKRIHRIGQQHPCLQIDLVTANTVDPQLGRILAKKTDQQVSMMTAFDLMNA